VQDPFAHEANEARDNRLARDPQVMKLAPRLMWLRILTGVLALALVAAVGITWALG
jgi:hypothetical protein